PNNAAALFVERFGISESDAALLITATMLPLAIAPLSYGYLLEAVPASAGAALVAGGVSNQRTGVCPG
ncbi:MAG: MFS transporter, partial [Chloroflexaceae bacterium]|nr:MFS transporter [Chloroflexaceae bacterium]